MTLCELRGRVDEMAKQGRSAVEICKALDCHIFTAVSALKRAGFSAGGSTGTGTGRSAGPKTETGR